jgi:hypothetical protein
MIFLLYLSIPIGIDPVETNGSRGIMRITSRKLGIGYEYNQQHVRIPATRSVVDGHYSREEHLSHAFSLLYMI